MQLPLKFLDIPLPETRSGEQMDDTPKTRSSIETLARLMVKPSEPTSPRRKTMNDLVQNPTDPHLQRAAFVYVRQSSSLPGRT